MDKKKVMKLVAAVSAMLGLIVVVMTLFFVNGREKQNAPVSVTGVEKEGSYSAKNTWRENSRRSTANGDGITAGSEKEEGAEPGSGSTDEENTQNGKREEMLGMQNGEEDDFTMASDPEHFDVQIAGLDEKAVQMTAPETVLHKQLKSWMEKNEFWDMTEVIYSKRYLQDEKSGETTLYLTIKRYPRFPLMAKWSDTQKRFSFEIEWS